MLYIILQMQSVKILNLSLKKNNLGEVKIMNIVIVGLGVIGGSFAKALKKLDMKMYLE